MEATSLPVQPPRAISKNSFGRGPALLPPNSGGPSIVTQWFESAFAANVIPWTCLTTAVRCAMVSYRRGGSLVYEMLLGVEKVQRSVALVDTGLKPASVRK